MGAPSKSLLSNYSKRVLKAFERTLKNLFFRRFEMPEILMSLADGAKALGLKPNGARSRFKAGKIKGERDNRGRILIWVDEAAEPSKQSVSNNSKTSLEGAPNYSKNAFEAHIRTLMTQLERAQTELSELRLRASAADRLEAEIAGLEALRDELRTDRDHWRQMAIKNQAGLEAARPLKRGLFGRLGRT